MIIVTSAAGHTGSYMVRALVANGFDVLATDINPKVTELPGIKASLVGDITNLNFQRELLSKGEQLVYIPPLFSAEEAEIGKSLVKLAAELKLEQFIFISVTHPILSTLLQHTAKQLVEERLIYEGMTSGLKYTILQPMHYMHNFDPKTVKETGKYTIFYDVDTPLSYVDPADVGEIVVAVASNIDHHNKATYELVGTAPFSPRELVEKYNTVTGEKAEVVYVTADDFLDSIDAQDIYFRVGFEHLADSYSRWGLDGNPNVLRMLLGREPTDFETYVMRTLKD